MCGNVKVVLADAMVALFVPDASLATDKLRFIADALALLTPIFSRNVALLAYFMQIHSVARPREPVAASMGGDTFTTLKFSVKSNCFIFQFSYISYYAPLL